MSQRWATGRVEAFSDGVFAIAITLLVLEIKIDPSEFDHLWRALADEWPAYLAYVTSFFTIGGVWLAHHGLFGRLEAVDPVLMRLNILLLMTVSFLPFPTGLMAEALKASESAERAAVVVYGVTAGAIELLMASSWRYAASQPGLLGDPDAPLPEHAQRRRGTLRGGLYGIALFLGLLVLPRLAAFGYFVVAGVAVLTARGEGRLTLRGPTPR
jgi:TMEM175 potassium channel family protein